LIDSGVDVNLVCNKNTIALHHAAEIRDLGITELLISCKSDINALDNLNRSPLHYSVGMTINYN